jgi:hypothetical protein
LVLLALFWIYIIKRGLQSTVLPPLPLVIPVVLLSVVISNNDHCFIQLPCRA